jgi:copper homeostasis protein
MTVPQRPLLEIAANSLASALAAEAGGADRIELCSALELGGLTPSHATIALARERIRIPLYVLIRPRAGNFVYAGCEFETMQHDIESCRALGCDGVVIGALDDGGQVDEANGRRLVDAAGGIGVTFHRAIDAGADPLRALERVIALGCERVLTSGGRRDAISGAAVIRAMVLRAAGRIRVMAGAGINAANAGKLRALTGAVEFHASAKRALPSRANRAPGRELGMDAGELRTDAAEVRAIVAALATSQA